MPEPLRWDMILPNGEPLRWDMPLFTWDGTVPETQTATPMQQNDIDITITAAQETEIITTLDTLRTKVSAFARALTQAQRDSYFKLGDGRLGFHTAANAYIHQRADTVPPTINVSAYDKDQAAWESLGRILAKLRTIESDLVDTQTTLGADLLDADLAYYNYLPLAADAGVAGAREIRADLKQHYPGRGRSAAPPATPPTP